MFRSQSYRKHWSDIVSTGGRNERKFQDLEQKSLRNVPSFGETMSFLMWTNGYQLCQSLQQPAWIAVLDANIGSSMGLRVAMAQPLGLYVREFLDQVSWGGKAHPELREHMGWGPRLTDKDNVSRAHLSFLTMTALWKPPHLLSMQAMIGFLSHPVESGKTVDHNSEKSHYYAGS